MHGQTRTSDHGEYNFKRRSPANWSGFAYFDRFDRSFGLFMISSMLFNSRVGKFLDVDGKFFEQGRVAAQGYFEIYFFAVEVPVDPCGCFL